MPTVGKRVGGHEAGGKASIVAQRFLLLKYNLNLKKNNINVKNAARVGTISFSLIRARGLGIISAHFHSSCHFRTEDAGPSAALNTFYVRVPPFWQRT